MKVVACVHLTMLVSIIILEGSLTPSMELHFRDVRRVVESYGPVTFVKGSSI
jgi:hypothetical protein